MSEKIAPTVYLKTYGCQMNERDSETVAAMLLDRGWSLTEREEEADIVLLNTCSVREQAEQKALGKGRHLLKKNPALLLGIMGCMAQNKNEALFQELPGLALLIGTQKFHRVPEYLEKLVADRKAAPLIDLGEESEIPPCAHVKKKKITAFVSIMQGCNMNCTYCIVPKVRGVERTKPMETILAEIEALVAEGTREVTLLGQTVNNYGKGTYPERGGKGPFVQLLEKIHAIKDLARIRFTSAHPCGFRRDLIDAYRDLPKLCNYVHLPVQSGSNRVLKAMNRPYRRERYLQIIESLRQVTGSNMYFSTDIIVGFPTETEEDFAETCSLFAEVGFDMAYIFKYSPRKGTAAMADTIARSVKEERHQILLNKVAEYSLQRNQSLVGSVQEVLVEGLARRDSLYRGRTRGYRKVIFPGKEELLGQCVPITILKVFSETLYGERVE